jgi:hypothetical protein
LGGFGNTTAWPLAEIERRETHRYSLVGPRPVCSPAEATAERRAIGNMVIHLNNQGGLRNLR